MAKVNEGDKEVEVLEPKDQSALGAALDSYQFDEDLDAVELSSIKEELGLELPTRAAKSMTGEKFIIVSAKPFPSGYDQPLEPLYCVCRDYPRGDYFGMVIGGTQPQQMLYGLMDAGFPNPIIVVLNYHAGKGQHDGYYTLD